MTNLMNVFKPIKNLKDVDKTCTYRKMNYKSSKLSLFFFLPFSDGYSVYFRSLE